MYSRIAVSWCLATQKAGPSEIGPARTIERAAAKTNGLRQSLGQVADNPNAWKRLGPELGIQASGPIRE